jgi:hypothetical protein
MLFGAIFLALLAAPLNVAYAGIGSGITNITIGTLNPASPFAYGPSSVQATLSAVASPPNEECEITITSWAWTWSASPGSCSLSTDTNQVSTIVWNWTQNPSLPGGVNSNSITVSVVLQGTNCSGSNFTTNYTVTTNFSVTVIQITNQCVFTNPAPQSRTNIGVCEKVSLLLVGSPSGTFTWSSSAGSLSTSSGQSTILTAPDTANNVTVTASYNGGSCTLPLTVVAPSGCLYTKTNGDQHIYPDTSAGFWANILILPTNVSFGNILIQEDRTVPTGQWGDLANSLVFLPQGSWVQVATNNMVKGQDGVCFDIAKYITGGMTWPVPMRYAVNTNNTNASYLFTTNTQAVSAHYGAAVMSKTGVSTTNIPDTAPSTSNWPSPGWLH